MSDGGTIISFQDDPWSFHDFMKLVLHISRENDLDVRDFVQDRMFCPDRWCEALVAKATTDQLWEWVSACMDNYLTSDNVFFNIIAKELESRPDYLDHSQGGSN